MEEEQLRKIIREMLEQSLNETQGVPDFVEEYSNIISDSIKNFIFYVTKNIKISEKEVFVGELNRKIKVNQIDTVLPNVFLRPLLNSLSKTKHYNHLPISMNPSDTTIRLNINFPVEDEISNNSATGSINSEKIFIGSDNLIRGVDLEIKVLFKNNNITLLNFDVINDKICHELNHIFESYNRILGGKTLKNANKTLRGVANYLSSISIYKSTYWKDFLFTFYLNSPEELNARIPEFYSELKTLPTSNKTDLLSSIKKTKIYNDYLRLSNFNGTETYNNLIIEIGQSETNALISLFYKTLSEIEDISGVKLSSIKPNLINANFFNFFEKRFKRSADIMIKKISKAAYLFAQKNNDRIALEEHEFFFYYGYLIK